MENEYEQIAMDAIEKAEAVGGSLEDFAEGMERIFYAVKERYELAKSEAESNS